MDKHVQKVAQGMPDEWTDIYLVVLIQILSFTHSHVVPDIWICFFS